MPNARPPNDPGRFLVQRTVTILILTSLFFLLIFSTHAKSSSSPRAAACGYGSDRSPAAAPIGRTNSSLRARRSGAYMAYPLAGRAWKSPGASARSV